MERLGKHWTHDETAYLEDHWGSQSVNAIAKALNRSPGAVSAKKDKLGLGTYIENSEHISFTSIVKTLYEHDCGNNRERLIDMGLKVVKKRVHKKCRTMVKTYAFWKWLEVNKDSFSLHRMEPYDLGPEPDWVDAKRQSDKAKVNKYNTRKEWTHEDDERLRFLISQYTYTYNDIARMMGRTNRSIAARCKRIGIKGLPLKEQTKWWTTKEIEKLHEMYAQGYSWDDMAEVLGRSARSVKGRIAREKKNAHTDGNQCKGA